MIFFQNYSRLGSRSTKRRIIACYHHFWHKTASSSKNYSYYYC